MSRLKLFSDPPFQMFRNFNSSAGLGGTIRLGSIIEYKLEMEAWTLQRFLDAALTDRRKEFDLLHVEDFWRVGVVSLKEDFGNHLHWGCELNFRLRLPFPRKSDSLRELSVVWFKFWDYIEMFYIN
ncbi:hypothetical protein CEXT_812281 [Caerostris extrusa]|uniref:Uncharacterized protein n=1 Tax=Caerostris extrusa TaxID=172846 RepID=A0AAV4PKI7_CAEEX|nr:hypothetical protein CEXT_812281 [Caerostris extrusa]